MGIKASNNLFFIPLRVNIKGKKNNIFYLKSVESLNRTILLFPVSATSKILSA